MYEEQQRAHTHVADKMICIDDLPDWSYSFPTISFLHEYAHLMAGEPTDWESSAVGGHTEEWAAYYINLVIEHGQDEYDVFESMQDIAHNLDIDSVDMEDFLGWYLPSNLSDDLLFEINYFVRHKL